MRIPIGIFAAAVLAACGGSNSFSSSTPMSVTPQIAAPQSMSGSALQRFEPLLARLPAGAGYKSLYSFKGGNDGASPSAGLTAVGSELYGTTYSGGKNAYGTVFEMSMSGKESVLHSFNGYAGGARPVARLIDVKGTLYGTTESGGTGSGWGTVFAISTTGTERVLHLFKGFPKDGATPLAGLIAVGGELYGTTVRGGKYDAGTVFVVSTTGTERVLHSFKGYPKDGEDPVGGLIAVGSELYGTTSWGGKKCYDYCGTVFEVSTSGQERVLHSFPFYLNDTDGAVPMASLIAVGDEMYGTTLDGGKDGYGTVFEMSTTGANYRVLHNFGSSYDGSNPYASVIAVGSELYGTTEDGGSYGSGTVFELSTSGKESILHSFKGYADGTDPQGGLIDVKGTLYGTTSLGGAKNSGTIFEVTP